MKAFEVHVFTDRHGRVCASVTDSDGHRTRPVVLPIGARFALEHILRTAKEAHETTEAEQ